MLFERLIELAKRTECEIRVKKTEAVLVFRRYMDLKKVLKAVEDLGFEIESCYRDRNDYVGRIDVECEEIAEKLGLEAGDFVVIDSYGFVYVHVPLLYTFYDIYQIGEIARKLERELADYGYEFLGVKSGNYELVFGFRPFDFVKD